MLKVLRYLKEHPGEKADYFGAKLLMERADRDVIMDDLLHNPMAKISLLQMSITEATGADGSQLTLFRFPRHAYVLICGFDVQDYLSRYPLLFSSRWPIPTPEAKGQIVVSSRSLKDLHDRGFNPFFVELALELSFGEVDLASASLDYLSRKKQLKWGTGVKIGLQHCLELVAMVENLRPDVAAEFRMFPEKFFARLNVQPTRGQLDAVRFAGDPDPSCHFVGILAQLRRELGAAMWDHVQVTADTCLSDRAWRDQVDPRWLVVVGRAVNWHNDGRVNSYFQIFFKDRAVIILEYVLRTHTNIWWRAVPRS